MGWKKTIRDIDDRLATGRMEVQASALKDAKDLIDMVSKVAVAGFKHTDNPFIYSERLSALGPTIIPYLESMHASCEKGEARTLLALVLLFHGNKSGLSDVLEVVRIEDKYQFCAAVGLANAGITDAVEPITNLLREYAFTQPLDHILGPKIGPLINSLTKLGSEIPEDIRERLTTPGVSKFVSAYVPKKAGSASLSSLR